MAAAVEPPARKWKPVYTSLFFQLLGNCVATLVVANWEKQLDKARFFKVLDQEPVPPLDAEHDPAGDTEALDDELVATSGR